MALCLEDRINVCGLKFPMDWQEANNNRTDAPGCCVMGPFVKIGFNVKTAGAEKNIITVGNNSTPNTDDENKNTTVIRDFELGGQDGWRARFTIHDTAGSDFAKLMENLLKDFKCSNPQGPQITIEFGWVHDKCQLKVPETSSPVYYFIIESVTANFTGGKFIYEFTAVDLMRKAFEGSVVKTYTGHFTEVVTKLFTDEDFPPRVKSVRFVKVVPGEGGRSTLIPAKFKDADDPLKGSKLEKWECKNLNKFQVVYDWIAKRGILSDNNKSFVACYNPEINGGEVLFIEDSKPISGETKSWDRFCIGTYIVNGGKESPVIEFNPKINYQYFGLVGAGGNQARGQVGDKNAGKFEGILGTNIVVKKLLNFLGALSQFASRLPGLGGLSSFSGLGGDDATGAGIQNTATTHETMIDKYGIRDASRKVKEAFTRHFVAFQTTPLAIEADLVLVGDPGLGRPTENFFQRNVRVIFVNPYHIVAAESNCAEWLAQPACNEVLSNNAWLIQRVTHHISLGKFTTTLGLYLTTPTIHIDLGETVGGLGAKGWTPPKQC